MILEYIGVWLKLIVLDEFSALNEVLSEDSLTVFERGGCAEVREMIRTKFDYDP